MKKQRSIYCGERRMVHTVLFRHGVSDLVSSATDLWCLKCISKVNINMKKSKGMLLGFVTEDLSHLIMINCLTVDEYSHWSYLECCLLLFSSHWCLSYWNFIWRRLPTTTHTRYLDHLFQVRWPHCMYWSVLGPQSSDHVQCGPFAKRLEPQIRQTSSNLALDSWIWFLYCSCCTGV